MQFFRVLFALVAAILASAQIPDLPPCSLNCFISALGSDGCEPLTNFACHCAQPGLTQDITPCVKKACDIPAQSTVSSIVVAQCSKAGHPVSLPPVGGASVTTSAAPSVTTAPAETTPPVDTGSASETAPITSTAASASPTGLETPSSGFSISPTSQSVIPSGTGSSSIAGSASGSVPGGSSAAPTSSSSSVPVFPGAAPNVQSNVVGVLGVAVAAVAAYAL